MTDAAKKLLVAIAFVLLPASSAQAGLLRLESETLFSVRHDPNLDMEYPLYEFFESSYSSSNNHVQINTNFGASTLMHQRFNLYILDLAYRPVRELSFRVGRSFNTRTALRTTVTDSASGVYSLLDNQVQVGAMLGVERKTLRNSLDSTAKFAGAHLDYRSQGGFPFFLGSQYIFRRPSTGRELPDQHLFNLATSKSFSFPWSPEILGNAQWNLGHKNHLMLAEGGLDLYPTYQTGLRLRALTYDTESDDDIEDPIFSIFSKGRLYEMKIQAEHEVTRVYYPSVSLAYDSYPYQADIQRSGIRFELGNKVNLEFIRLYNATYFFKSYGGSAYGNRLSVTKDFTSQVDLQVLTDFTYYDKITSSKTFALNNQAWFGFWALKRFKINTGFEFDSNNTYRYDFRFSTKLTYLLWKEL